MCRKCHGALFASFSVYPKEAWSLTSGELTVFHSSKGVTRQFCGSCGCQILSTVASTPEVVYVTSGSLDPAQTERVHALSPLAEVRVRIRVRV